MGPAPPLLVVKPSWLWPLPVCHAGVMVALRKLGTRERTMTSTLWYHATSVLVASGPLLCGWPRSPVVPQGRDWVWVGLVVATSFFGALLQTRGVQLLPAAEATAIKYLQVSNGRGV